jgi:hypothetical protein
VAVTSCYYSPLTSSACNSGYRHIYNNLLKISGKHLYKSLFLEFLSHFQKQSEASIIMSTTCMLDREEHCTNLLLWPELCQLVTDSHLSQLILLTATMEQNHFSAKQKHKCCFKEFQASVLTNIEAKQSGNVVSISSLLKTQRSLASCTYNLLLYPMLTLLHLGWLLPMTPYMHLVQFEPQSLSWSPWGLPS